jgi:hypothetical protein
LQVIVFFYFFFFSWKDFLFFAFMLMTYHFFVN